MSRLSTLVTKDKRSPDGKAISASTESGKIAVFTYTMKGTGGSPVYFKTQIRKEDGRWQVMSFRSSEKKLSTDVEAERRRASHPRCRTVQRGREGDPDDRSFW